MDGNAATCKPALLSILAQRSYTVWRNATIIIGKSGRGKSYDATPTPLAGELPLGFPSREKKRSRFIKVECPGNGKKLFQGSSSPSARPLPTLVDHPRNWLI